MIGKIFAVLVIASIFFAICTGNLSALSNAVLDGADAAVTLTISLLGVTCLWCGIMSVLERAGAIRRLSRLISPILRFVFPGAYQTKQGINEISANVSANILGIGNAATPLGIRAMEKLKEAARDPTVATDDMVMLAVINTASLDLFPTTLIALRRAAGSSAPYVILLPVLICSLCTSIFAVLITKLFSKIF